MRTLRSLARLDLDELRDELPPATVEALLHRLLLCIETQAGAALSVCADAVVGNELPWCAGIFVSAHRDLFHHGTWEKMLGFLASRDVMHERQLW